jgi:hypothetical protein
MRFQENQYDTGLDNLNSALLTSNARPVQFRLKFEAQNLSDLAHGTPFGWHRLPRDKKSGSLARKCKFRWAVTFGRNDRSRSNGISGQIGPEYALMPRSYIAGYQSPSSNTLPVAYG